MLVVVVCVMVNFEVISFIATETTGYRQLVYDFKHSSSAVVA